MHKSFIQSADIVMLATVKPRGGLRPTVVICPECGECTLTYGLEKGLWVCPDCDFGVTTQQLRAEADEALWGR